MRYEYYYYNFGMTTEKMGQFENVEKVLNVLYIIPSCDTDPTYYNLCFQV